MSDVLIRRLREANVAVVFDEVENSRWWMLRSVPIINYLVADAFTYPTSWRQLGGGRQYEYLDFDYHVIGGIQFDELPPFGIITNRHYEEETQFSIQPLIDKYTSANAPLVVVSDSEEFTPEGGPRPLAQEPFAIRIGSFGEVFDAIENEYEKAGFSMPLRDTRNVFLQDNAILYERVEDTTLHRVTKLFDVLPDSPYLPLYDVFADIFSQEDELGSMPLETDEQVDGLGRWIRRRVELERSQGQEIAKEMNRAVAGDATTFDLSYAKRNISVAGAWKVAEKIDNSASTIHARYSSWLARFR
jgi:hypothetical protein